MADGLLLTRRERLRLFWSKVAASFAAPVLLGSARTPRGALLGGLVVAVLLFLLQLLVAHVASHPIE